MTTLTRLLALASVPRKRVALAVLLGTLTIVFGVGLMATAGYLISRAAERPAILSLTVAIVAVRFFGLARPLARYLERLSSHDVAFRALGRARRRVYERIEPLAPAELRGDRRGPRPRSCRPRARCWRQGCSWAGSQLLLPWSRSPGTVTARRPPAAS